MSDEITVYVTEQSIVIRDGEFRRFIANLDLGFFVNDSYPILWSGVEEYWRGKDVWSGPKYEWDTLRAVSETPTALIENVKALAAKQTRGSRASDDATILDFLEGCGISAPDLEEARKIVIRTLDETRGLRAKLDQERESHKQCSDSLRAANKRADDAETRIAQMRTILGPKDPIVAGGFYRDGEGALWYVPCSCTEVTSTASFACGAERWTHPIGAL